MIIDVVEPLYHTMMSQYGKVLDPADVLLVMEVAQTEEDHTLLEVMLRTIYEKVRCHYALGVEARTCARWAVETTGPILKCVL